MEGIPGRNPRRTILIVDDEAHVREIVSLSLEDLGFDVLAAGSGEDAVGIVRARGSDIDLVVLDFTLDGLSGEETWRAIRSVREDLPIVLMSGEPEGEVLRILPEARPDHAFLSKPFDAAALQQVIHALLEKRAD